MPKQTLTLNMVFIICRIQYKINRHAKKHEITAYNEENNQSIQKQNGTDNGISRQVTL